MKHTDIQDGVHVDIELGAVHASLYEADILIRKSTHHVHAHEDIAIEFLRDVKYITRDVCDVVTRGVDVKKIFVTIQTPLTFFIEDSFLYATKKDAPMAQNSIQEIDVTLPTYIKSTLGTHVQDGVLVQHVPEVYTIRGFEVSKDTHVAGPYEGVQMLQWVTRSVYEAIRELTHTYANAVLSYAPPTSYDIPTMTVGSYVSTFSLPNKLNDLPLGIGEKSLLHTIAKEFDVKEAIVKSTLRGHYVSHIRKGQYQKYASQSIYDAFEKMVRFMNMHSYQNRIIIQAPDYLESIVRTAIKPFVHGLSTMNIDRE